MKESTAQEKQNRQFDLWKCNSERAKNVTSLVLRQNIKNDPKDTTLQIHPQQIRNLGQCQIKTKITYVFLVWICFGCFPWICRGAGGCPNNPDAAIREKVSKKAMVVTGSLNQPALLTSSRATLPRKIKHLWKYLQPTRVLVNCLSSVLLITDTFIQSKYHHLRQKV